MLLSFCLTLTRIISIEISFDGQLTVIFILGRTIESDFRTMSSCPITICKLTQNYWYYGHSTRDRKKNYSFGNNDDIWNTDTPSNGVYACLTQVGYRCTLDISMTRVWHTVLRVSFKKYYLSARHASNTTEYGSNTHRTRLGRALDTNEHGSDTTRT